MFCACRSRAEFLKAPVCPPFTCLHSLASLAPVFSFPLPSTLSASLSLSLSPSLTSNYWILEDFSTDCFFPSICMAVVSNKLQATQASSVFCLPKSLLTPFYLIALLFNIQLLAHSECVLIHHISFHTTTKVDASVLQIRPCLEGKDDHIYFSSPRV